MATNAAGVRRHDRWRDIRASERRPTMSEAAQLRDVKLGVVRENWTNAGPVVSQMPDQDLNLLRERAAATIADPSALGLWGFATGTWMAATVLGGFVEPLASWSLAPTVILFAGIAQFIAGLYAFRRTNALHATAFTCFGAFNTVAGIMLTIPFQATRGMTPGYHLMLGFLLESFAFISLALMVGALRRNAVLTLLLGALFIGYCLTGIGQFTIGNAAAIVPAATASGAHAGAAGAAGNGPGVIAGIGGGFLWLSAICAYYLGAALLVNSTWHRRVLPIMGEP
ncbi:acetate uptake transporter family protein [Rhodopila globiformis]|nr:GPR1/FUN34/YaaH family transporter [Rhodopila globiformis]